jgi:hypothetical protein
MMEEVAGLEAGGQPRPLALKIFRMLDIQI